MPKMTIPQIRERLVEIANEMEAYGGKLARLYSAEIRELAYATHRQSPVRRTAVKSRRLTVGLAAAIRDYARRNPKAAMADIAREFKVNPGRVSEAMNFKV